jgi:hypothetical protein
MDFGDPLKKKAPYLVCGDGKVKRKLHWRLVAGKINSKLVNNIE